eukprot:2331409-Ditylum_brightwellii.AAC.1
MASHGREARKLPFPVCDIFDWEVNYFPYRQKDLEEDEVITALPANSRIITGVLSARLLAVERAPIKQRRGRMSTDIVEIDLDSDVEGDDDLDKESRYGSTIINGSGLSGTI